ncbi:uncharacterized protein LOC120267185 [Dioscorea cayenensis subsp. rotundata]|uniref:Uncharacterized protein LOC120267185 n=1 Tax=Dioscorea cayennensis subsp. rotundata TaxID=55577 RepID=A0AB40BW64_DIOCR|nr:uncharacterized protein LOC120267185 [Dioscorea cayenensis subsp. rotundata]
MICLTETRANDDRVNRFCRCLPVSWDWSAILADGFSGGILVAWRKVIGRVSPIAISRRALHMIISPNQFGNCIISVIYNSVHFHSQCSLWNELSRFSSIGIPWLVIGDFNTICSSDEHRGGSFYYYARKARYFVNFIESTNLLDLQFIGPRFTWCNKKAGTARRWARLDRGLINLEWSSRCRSTRFQHLPKVFSDHAPLLVTVNLSNSHIRSPFRFNNYWLDYVGCHSVVRRAWAFSPNGTPMHAFTHLLFRLRANILNWCKEGLTNLDMDIKNTESIISSLEMFVAFDDGTQGLLEEMYAKYAMLEKQNTNKWAQRAHLAWVCDGDTNSKFFHNATRIRRHINQITQVKDVGGNLFTERSGIENAFLNFYSRLWTGSTTDSFADIMSDIPNDLPQLSDMDCDFLIREVTREEVRLSVFELPLGKCPGPDAFNAEFYRFFWADIEDSLFEAVNFFFTNSIMPNSWGKSYIALIPKKDSPMSVTDYRPISLCNVCFKIISKILANRLKLVLPNLIGFDMRLRSNFNHLMFADDLVIITQMSRKAARSIKICLDFYGKISGQVANVSKSAIYYPTWASKRVASRICSILNFSAATFPFRYLGILISPKRLAKSTFAALIDNIKNRCSRWVHSKLSPAAKTVLINTSLLSLPIYYMSVYPIYDSILLEIHRIVRRFFWSKSSNGKGIHVVAWNDLTISKTEGGLAIRNLTLAKHSLMAKNVFKDSIPSGCSWFFRGLCYIVIKVNPSLRINSVNPDHTSLYNHPWCSEVPLSLCPTYFNVNLNLDSLGVSDFCSNGSWDLDKLGLLFGDWLDCFIPKLGVIDSNGNNHWVWSSKSVNQSTSAIVYHYLNSSSCWIDGWPGWKRIWHLNVAPRVQHFLWLAFKGRVSTYDYLYSINLSPRNFCAMCNLMHESIEHLLYSCNLAQAVWGHVCTKLNIPNPFSGGFCFGEWLICDLLSPFAKAVIASATWFLWKNRCDKIFRSFSVSSLVIVSRAFSHARDFSFAHADKFGSRLILNNFSFRDGLFLFVVSQWIEASEVLVQYMQGVLRKLIYRRSSLFFRFLWMLVAAVDETLRFWNVFGTAQAPKPGKKTALC